MTIKQGSGSSDVSSQGNLGVVFLLATLGLIIYTLILLIALSVPGSFGRSGTDTQNTAPQTAQPKTETPPAPDTIDSSAPLPEISTDTAPPLAAQQIPPENRRSTPPNKQETAISPEVGKTPVPATPPNTPSHALPKQNGPGIGALETILSLPRRLFQ